MNTAPAPTAYGLGFAGLGADPALLGPPRPNVTPIRVSYDQDRGDPLPGRHVDDAHAELTLGATVRLVLDRAAGTATYQGGPIPPDQRVHPYLSPVGIVHNRWLGREVFHAGAVAVDGRAWVVIGPREAGKSTLMAELDARGHTVLADDIAVIGDGNVFAGPRCVDLRHPVPGARRPGSFARGDTRLRLLLPPAPFAVPLAGWVFPVWDARTSVGRIPAPRVLGMLSRRRLHRQLDSDSGAMLDLAGRPGLRWSRPREWARRQESLQLLLGALAADRAPTSYAGR